MNTEQQEQTLEQRIDTEAMALFNYYKNQGYMDAEAYVAAEEIRKEYEVYYKKAERVCAVQRWIEYDTFLNFCPHFEDLSLADQIKFLWENGWDSKSYHFDTMKRLVTKRNGQRSVEKVLYGWERSDKEWLNKRNKDYEKYASMEAQLVHDAKFYDTRH